MQNICSFSLRHISSSNVSRVSLMMLSRSRITINPFRHSSFIMAPKSIRFATTMTETASPTPVSKRWRNIRRVIYSGLLGSIVYTGYVIYEGRHPSTQLPFDASKKSLIILGSGWASTSFLKALDTENYNVVVISPRNYFLFTPLLPSCTVGTVDVRSIIEPIRYITRHKKREVKVYEAECTDIDPTTKTITISDNTEVKGEVASQTLQYDYLVIGVGAENQTFGIPGVYEYSCFLKEIQDAQNIRTRLMDCVETAAFAGQPEKERDRLLHMVVVGGGPTGVEYAAELHDFLKEDLVNWYPGIVDHLEITLVEALPNVLPAFSKQLIDYTESTFKEQHINILTKTMVKEVRQKEIVVQKADGSSDTIPFGLLVWAAGNTSRSLVRNLMAKLPESQTVRRGLSVDNYLRLQGVEDVWALGDVTATKYAPTAQVASQQGKYLARIFNQIAIKDELSAELVAFPEQEQEKKLRKLNRLKDVKPFEYSHQGLLAYIGSEKAIADLPFGHWNVSAGGVAIYVFWRSAYISNLFSVRNRCLVALDWSKQKIFGRDISRE